jgi:hypothetical protein
MKVARTIFASAVICAMLLAIAFTPGAKAQTREEWAARYEYIAQYCEREFPTNPATIVAKVQCLNKAQAEVLPSWGNNRDLIETWMAYRAAIAEQIQDKKITFAEGIAAISQRWSEAQTEIQRRNAYAAQADAARAAAPQSAQEKALPEAERMRRAIYEGIAIEEENERRQNAIAAQQNAADRANDIAEAQMWINAFQAIKPVPAPAPNVRLQTTCMQNGNFTYCH